MVRKTYILNFLIVISWLSPSVEGHLGNCHLIGPLDSHLIWLVLIGLHCSFPFIPTITMVMSLCHCHCNVTCWTGDWAQGRAKRLPGALRRTHWTWELWLWQVTSCPAGRINHFWSFRNLGHELVKLGLAEALGDEAEVRLATRDNWEKSLWEILD